MTTVQPKDLPSGTPALTDVLIFQTAAGGTGSVQKTTPSAILGLATGPTINVLASNVTAYTVVNGDLNNVIETTAATTVTITIPSTLTSTGAITVSKGGSGNAVLAAGSGVTLDKPGSKTTLTTLYETMSALPWGSTTHYRLAGAES